MWRNESPEKFNPERRLVASRLLSEKKLMSRLVPLELGARMAPSRRSQRFSQGGTTVMSTLAVVEEILRETAVPMSVREIVERAGARLPSKSKTPDTVVARDLSMDIKKKGEGSLFVRTSPGRYTLRNLAAPSSFATAADQVAPVRTPSVGAQSMSTLPARKPAAPAPARPGRDREAEGGELVG
jgi:HB1, ASXL, restriction endonuclease HTH domain